MHQLWVVEDRRLDFVDGSAVSNGPKWIYNAGAQQAFGCCIRAKRTETAHILADPNYFLG